MAWTFLRGIAFRDRDLVAKAYRGAVRKASLNEVDGTRGGYVTPVDYSQAFLRTVAESSFLIPRAFHIPLKSGQARVPKLDMETVQSAGTSPFFGGMVFSWQNPEDQAVNAVTETEPTFNETTLKPWDLIGVQILSNQFLADIGEEGEKKLVQIFARCCAWSEEYAYFQGSGVGQPLGILNAPCSISSARTAGNQIAVADISTMLSKLLPSSFTNAIWACSPSALAQITKISGWQPNQYPAGPEDGVQMAGWLMSRPLFVTEKLPALGTAGDLVLLDPMLYAIGDRQDVVIEASPHPRFRQNQTVFRVWRRVDGKPILDGAVTLQDASSTASGFVYLAA